MKKIQILIILIITVSCKAQSPIINLLDDDGSGIANAYYKDVNNLLDQYEGTYVYTNGNTFFKIVLAKKIMQYNNVLSYYEDLIIGEYKYIVNGIQIVNTLWDINTNFTNQFQHNISGNTLISNNNRLWLCSECGVGEKRLKLNITDTSTGRYAELIARKTTENGQQRLKIKISNVSGGAYDVNIDPPADFALPTGDFILIKQ